MAGRDLLQIGIRGRQQLGCTLALAGSLLRAYPWGELDNRIYRAAVSHYLFLRGGARSGSSTLPVPPFLAGCFLRCRCSGFRLLRSRPGLFLLRLWSGLWRRFHLRRGRRLGLRSGAGLRRLSRWTSRRRILRGVLGGAGWRCFRCRLGLLVELRKLCQKRAPRDGRSRQRTKSEDDGQIQAHVKLDAATTGQAYPEFYLPGWGPGCSLARILATFTVCQRSSFALRLPAGHSSETAPGAGAAERSCPHPQPIRSPLIRSATAESDKSAPARSRSLLSWW